MKFKNLALYVCVIGLAVLAFYYFGSTQLPSAQAQSGYTVTGRITWPNGEPISGIEIDGFPEIVQTDSEGYYSYTDTTSTIQEPTEYEIIPLEDYFEYSPSSRLVTVPPSHTGQDFIATPATPYSASGRVTDPDGNPISGVHIYHIDAHFELETFTDENGFYEIGLPCCNYNLNIDKEGYTFSPPAQMVSVPPDATDVDFVGTPEGQLYTISGRVTNGTSDDPTPGVAISIKKDGLNQAASAVTNADGYYNVADLEAGNYLITPSKGPFGFSPDWHAVTLPPDATRQDFDWKTPRHLDLRLEDAGDKVLVRKSPGSYVDIVAKFSADKNYGVSSVPATTTLTIDTTVLEPAVITSFVRTLPNNVGRAGVATEDLGSGRYRVSFQLKRNPYTGPDQPDYYNEVVWRFKVKDDAGLGPVDICADGAVYISQTQVADSPDCERLLISKPHVMIVTNRQALFDRYGVDPNLLTNIAADGTLQISLPSPVGTIPLGDYYTSHQTSRNDQAWRDVSAMLEYLYQLNVHVIDVHQYGIDYKQSKNSISANNVVNQIDTLIEDRFSHSMMPNKYLMIVGGDEIIPFFRTNDNNYCWFGTCEYNWTKGNVASPFLDDPAIWAYHQGWFFSDNIYGALSGGEAES